MVTDDSTLASVSEWESCERRREIRSDYDKLGRNICYLIAHPWSQTKSQNSLTRVTDIGRNICVQPPSPLPKCSPPSLNRARKVGK